VPRCGRDGGRDGRVEGGGEGRRGQEGEVLVEVLQAVEAVQLLANLTTTSSEKQTRKLQEATTLLFITYASPSLFLLKHAQCVQKDLLQAHGAILAAAAARLHRNSVAAAP
jgi:hypothetical protein